MIVDATAVVQQCTTELKIDRSATEKFYGTIIAFHSVGQIMGAPLVGYWSNRCKNISTPLVFGLSLMFTGNLLYFFVEAVPSNRKYFILFARFIIGVGSCKSLHYRQRVFQLHLQATSLCYVCMPRRRRCRRIARGR